MFIRYIPKLEINLHCFHISHGLKQGIFYIVGVSSHIKGHFTCVHVVLITCTCK